MQIKLCIIIPVCTHVLYSVNQSAIVSSACCVVPFFNLYINLIWLTGNIYNCIAQLHLVLVTVGYGTVYMGLLKIYKLRDKDTNYQLQHGRRKQLEYIQFLLLLQRNVIYMCVLIIIVGKCWRALYGRVPAPNYELGIFICIHCNFTVFQLCKLKRKIWH